MNEKALAFLKNSFLKSWLESEEITDLSYNGETLFYQHNREGRKKADLVLSKEEAFDFVRQIANLTEQLFSYASPILDVSVGPFRINAVHPAIGRKKYERTVTFSIRIGHPLSGVLDQDETFMPAEVRVLLLSLLLLDQSLVIAGKTGSGKTELQKYLLRNLPENAHIVVVDNVQELEEVSGQTSVDLTLWQTSHNVHEASFGDLIRNALRSNPDWLIVAEARGKEMIEVLNAAMTGHPVITTLHSQDLESMPSRMARMVLMGDEHLRYDQVLHDIHTHFPFLIYLSRRLDPDQRVKRFVQAVGEIQKDGTLRTLYEHHGTCVSYGSLSVEAQKALREDGFDMNSLERFVK